MASISRTPSIYQIRHIESGKVYVGSAIRPNARWREHFHLLKHGKHHARHLQHAWNKYGKDAFVFEIIEPVLFVEDLLIREQYWIDKLHACNDAYGFNVLPIAGSRLGLIHDEGTRAKISDAGKGRKPTAQANANVSASLMGHPVSDETKAKIREKAIERAKTAKGRAALLSASAKAKTPAARAKHRTIKQAQCNDPEWREKKSAAMKAYYETEAGRAKMIAARRQRAAKEKEKRDRQTHGRLPLEQTEE